MGGTAAAEWLGPRLGSILGSAPQLAVLSLIFFSIEQGPAFAAESAFWTIPGMGASVPVYLGYLVATRLVPSPRVWSVIAGVSLGTATFVVATLALSAIPLGPLTAMPFAAAVCLGAAFLVRRLPDSATLRRGPTSVSLLTIRVVVSALTVLVVIEKVALVEPAGTMRVPPVGRCATALLLYRLTVAPPGGAALLNVTVPVDGWPPVTVDGLTLTD